MTAPSRSSSRASSTRPNLRVNFVLSLREDAWAKLDRFKGRIPLLFENYLRVEHLDRTAARAAIDGPVDEWNSRLPPGERALRRRAGAGRGGDRGGGRGQARARRRRGGRRPEAADADAIEAPFLQLVMERLWRETVAAGGTRSTCARLEKLGGAQQIVENHLLEALGKLSHAEQDVAADVFRFLVTRSKTKIAHPATDLADWTRPEPEVTAVLEKLCRGESGRILRSVSPPAGETATRYELFHDVLAEPILEWRRGTSSGGSRLPRRSGSARSKKLRRSVSVRKRRPRRSGAGGDGSAGSSHCSFSARWPLRRSAAGRSSSATMPNTR